MGQHHADGTWTYRDGWTVHDSGNRYRDLLWVLTGSLLVAAGSTLSLIWAFDGLTLPVYAGFILFFTGYRASQYGLHQRDPERSNLDQFWEQITNTRLKNLAMIIIGGAAISHGFSTFIQSILSGSLYDGGLAGIMMLSGYMVAHLAVNNTLI